MSKFITLVISWLAVAMLLQHMIDSGTIYQATGIQANTRDAIQLQAGIWDAFLLGFPALWFLSQFVKWFD
jgi:hypothetical protein